MNRFPTAKMPLHADTSGDLQGTNYNWKRALLTYVKSIQVFACPSNDSLWNKADCGPGCIGDETNCVAPWKDNPQAQIPISYAYNSFFYENAPFDGELQRPREESEIKDTSGLVLITETLYGCGDVYPGYENQELFSTGSTSARTSSSPTSTRRRSGRHRHSAPSSCGATRAIPRSRPTPSRPPSPSRAVKRR